MKTFSIVEVTRLAIIKPIACLLIVAIAALPFAGCGNPLSSELEYDILLTGDNEQDIGPAVFAASERITRLAQNPGERLRIGLSRENGGVEVVVLSFTKDSGGDFRPTLTRSDGEQAYLRFGLDGLKPVIRFTDESGNILNVKGKQLSFAVDESALAKITKVVASGRQVDLREWVSVGIVAIAGGIAVWVGAGIVRLAAIGVGYLAVAAILVGGIVIGIAAFKALLALLGWEPGDIIALFQGALEDTISILAGAVEQFQQTYNLKIIGSSKGQEKNSVPLYFFLRI